MLNSNRILFFLSVINLSLTSSFVFAQLQDANKTNIKEIFISPSGPYAVGRMSYDWIDSMREETFSNKKGTKREIMVYVYYPAIKKSNSIKAPYIPHFYQIEKAIGETNMASQFGDAFPYIKSGQLRAHAVENAQLELNKQKYPVLIFSHGFGETGLIYSLMLEDLASHGYIIFSIEHPYDAYAVAFPDGRVVPFASEKWDEARKVQGGSAKYQNEQIPIRASDILFVINQVNLLSKEKSKSIFGNHLDLEKIGVFGHSLGGMAAARACQLTTLIHACINLDAEFRGPPYVEYSPNDPIKQPFLFFVSQHSLYISKHILPPTNEDLTNMKLTRRVYDSLMNSYQTRQNNALANMSGGSYRVSIEANGFVHRSFIDTKLFEKMNDTTILNQNLKNIEMIRAYTLAFFDKYLKNINASLLDNNSNKNSGVKIERFPPHLK